VTDDPHEPSRPERLIRGARAARALSEVLWETLEDAVAESQTVRVAELSARLAEISLAVASLADATPQPAVPDSAVPESGVSEPVVPESAVPEPEARSAEPSAPAPESERTSERDTDLAPEHGPVQEHDDEREAVASAAVLVDELASHDRPEALGTSRSEPQAQPSIEIRDERVPTMGGEDALSEQAHTRPDERARDGYAEPAVADAEPAVADTQPAHADAEPAVAATQPAYADAEPAVAATQPAHAERGAGPAPWIASLERRLERHQQDGRAFALLLLELADVQRLRHAELPGEVARLTTLVETELSAQLRPADSLMRETPGRYWLLAPQTDDSAAHGLAEQMTAVVGRTASHRGAPLRLAVGIAVCPRDALDAAELVDRAEVALYQAHASGRALAPAADPPVLYDDLD
jgi:GGDEF domain-containing protein